MSRCNQAAFAVAVQVAADGTSARTTLSLPEDGPTKSAVVTREYGLLLCVTEIVWPSKVILAVRLVLEPTLAVKEKLTTPLVVPLMSSHGWLLVGLNGGSRFCAVGNTTGKASLPAAGGSNLAVGSTKAYGSSLIV